VTFSKPVSDYQIESVYTSITMVVLKNYASFFSKLSLNRKPSVIRELTKVLTFPFKKITIDTKDDKQFILEGSKLQSALQYLPTPGLPSLVKWLEELQEQIHGPPKKTDLVVTSGSQDGLCKAIEMLMEPGSPVIVEEFIYAGTLTILNPYCPQYLVVKSDSEGMVPESLRSVLAKAATKPKVIYINPTGANPTGTVLTESRRKEIYAIASEYNLIILEDDPYFFLQYLPNRPSSFLSLDTEGRVLRFDSFSKVLSSGIRLGFVTGPPPLIERINLHMQASVLHASSLSQVIAYELLSQWKIQGFLQHVDFVEHFYQSRRDLMVEAAEKHLTGICQWSVPDGGMFLWLRVPQIPDTWDMLMKKGLERNIMLLPGKGFMPSCSISDSGQQTSSYMRAAFSVAPEEKFDMAFERLAQLIKDEIKCLKS